MQCSLASKPSIPLAIGATTMRESIGESQRDNFRTFLFSAFAELSVLLATQLECTV